MRNVKDNPTRLLTVKLMKVMSGGNYQYWQKNSWYQNHDRLDEA